MANLMRAMDSPASEVNALRSPVSRVRAGLDSSIAATALARASRSSPSETFASNAWSVSFPTANRADAWVHAAAGNLRQQRLVGRFLDRVQTDIVLGSGGDLRQQRLVGQLPNGGTGDDWVAVRDGDLRQRRLVAQPLDGRSLGAPRSARRAPHFLSTVRRSRILQAPETPIVPRKDHFAFIRTWASLCSAARRTAATLSPAAIFASSAWSPRFPAAAWRTSGIADEESSAKSPGVPGIWLLS